VPEGEAVSELTGAPESRIGREVVDSGGRMIGPVVGRAYARNRFGTTWLLVRTSQGRVVLVPADQMRESGGRLMLPYSQTYVESAPGVEEGLSLSQNDERRLRLHYGIGSGGPAGGCRAGCGLCMVNRRELHRSAAHSGSSEEES
jgi:hypothetical protein